MYVAMGHGMWGWPIPAFCAPDAANGLMQLLLCVAIIVINRQFFVNGARAVVHKNPNMDTLVSLGAGASFAYSVVMLFAMINGNAASSHDLYFEGAGTILTLITVGKLLEAVSKGKTADAINDLKNLAPPRARRIRDDGSEEIVPVEQLSAGDLIAVPAGMAFPADGEIADGECAVDESSLTGESESVMKRASDPVYTGTINLGERVVMRAVTIGDDTVLSRIIQTVSDTNATKAPIARIADRVSGVFVPSVIAIALITAGVWLIIGKGATYALARAVAVLVVSCPCALGLATPVAIMAGTGRGARAGILFRTAASLEMLGRVRVIALDKTGTVTYTASNEIRPEAAAAVGELRRLGIKTVMLSGDKKPAAQLIASAAGIDEVHAELLPNDKGAAVESLKNKGTVRVAMVGDGINDAPALAAADVGIAVAASLDVAANAADVVLLRDDIGLVPAAVKLSGRTLRIIHENLFWAFAYNIIGIPLAAGVWAHLGLVLNPMFAAAAMAVSSFIVVINALRLYLVKL